jgi:hypothetical protein
VSRLSGLQLCPTYESYLNSVANALTEALNAIEPRYVHLAESVMLANIAEQFSKDIEAGGFLIIPEIGSVNNFMDLLSKIFYKNGVYPEVRIIAGLILHNLQTTLLRLGIDPILYKKTVGTVLDLSKLIEDSVPEIQRIKDLVPWYRGSPLEYLDAVLDLLAESQFAEYFFNDMSTANMLTKKAEEMTERYNIIPTRL